MNYKEQYNEIKELLNSIDKKSKVFAETHDNPYYDDLTYVIETLTAFNAFLTKH